MRHATASTIHVLAGGGGRGRGGRGDARGGGGGRGRGRGASAAGATSGPEDSSAPSRGGGQGRGGRGGRGGDRGKPFAKGRRGGAPPGDVDEQLKAADSDEEGEVGALVALMAKRDAALEQELAAHDNGRGANSKVGAATGPPHSATWPHSAEECIWQGIAASALGFWLVGEER